MRHSPHDITETLAALHAGEYQAARAGHSPRPFVTISRQAGAGGRTLATALVDHLNRTDAGELPWTAWDDELVERVARERDLPPERVAALEGRQPTWLEEALGGLAMASNAPAEATVFRGMAMSVRALAELGRVVIVGRGAVFMTGDLPGGVHVRLVAPVAARVSSTAAERRLSPAAAAEWVRETDRARAAFYRRHWPGGALNPEAFTMTLNTAALSLDRQARAIIAALPVGVPMASDVPQAQAGADN
jgi:hypothetical protein